MASADGTLMSTPSVLGLRISPSGPLSGAPWRVGLTWDARLYTTSPTVDVRRVGASEVVESLPLPEVALAGDRAEVELPVPQLAKAGESCELVAGALAARAYPDDLVEGPIAASGRLLHGRSEVAVVDLSTVSTGPVPWGATIGVEWSRDDSGVASYPTFIVLTSVGPDPVPGGASIHIDVSAPAVSDVSIREARTADAVAYPGESRSSATGLRRSLEWTLHSPLPQDTSVYLALDAVLADEPQDPGDGPLVEFRAPQGTLARAARLTRAESSVPL